jgi:hypothetical protein
MQAPTNSLKSYMQEKLIAHHIWYILMLSSMQGGATSEQGANIINSKTL